MIPIRWVLAVWVFIGFAAVIGGIRTGLNGTVLIGLGFGFLGVLGFCFLKRQKSF